MFGRLNLGIPPQAPSVTIPQDIQEALKRAGMALQRAKAATATRNFGELKAQTLQLHNEVILLMVAQGISH